ncbi:RNA 2',3'-cyclic phosphodiesterase [Pseudoroseicyclus aestuarii]|uniref:RNA 2',3'-cyclic phosphodiesterase n=1 Tax=Pseudoroseicyclus aestuarii TaxID=1795041 RepID=A0A318SUX2_9RHOB|nr:RNA 2',3'-cyclic phosphodiesterase [Pseudoroseicyclus aestuarii]PYE85710.1 2'-5' RNA ligase [Pseudoroseicyclus aestuarii]
MRCFIAIPLPRATRIALETVQEALPFGTPTDPEQLHLTLAFLGEQPDHAVEAAHEALEGLRFAPFQMQLRGLHAPGKRPETLWAGLADPAPVAALHEKIRAALYGADIVLERRRFRPHVTLARLGPMDPQDEARLARTLATWDGFPSPPVTVEGLALYRSTLTKAGPIHDELAFYPASPLASAPGA